jgi:hypothetical protein
MHLPYYSETTDCFSQWHVPVCALFKGRLIDRPDAPMLGTPETSGGEVEHDIYMLEGTILLVFELKLAFRNEMDHIAQVLLGLICELDTFLRKGMKLKRSSGIQAE